MAIACEQEPASGPTPSATNDSIAYEGDRCVIPDPVCPDCGSHDVTRNGTYRRNPNGPRPATLPATGPLWIQEYLSQCCGAYLSPSLPFIDDGYRYTDEMRRDIQAIDTIYPATIDRHRRFCTVRYNATPSRTALDDWTRASHDTPEDTDELVVTNDLPTYSGVYLLDEDWITIGGDRWYRVTVYDALMHAPVLEGLTTSGTNEAIAALVEPVLRTKPMLAVLTDGRTGSASLVEDTLGGLHYRCVFHKNCNLREALWDSLDQDEAAPDTDRSAIEAIAVRRICSDV